jgi:hypothetical protein
MVMYRLTDRGAALLDAVLTGSMSGLLAGDRAGSVVSGCG